MLTLLAAGAVPFMLLGDAQFARMPRWLRALFVIGLALVIAGCLAHAVVLVRENLATPQKWDFLHFWVHARVAALGENFYDPAAAARVAAGRVSPMFLSEELGFRYPPPAMFLFVPLGWLEPRNAARAWFAAGAIVLALALSLSWRLFLRDRGARGFLLAGALLLLLRGTQETIGFAQTGILTLVFVLLAWQDRNRARSGLWVAIAAMVKPLAFSLVLFFLWGRRWRALAALSCGVAVLLLLAAIAFGPQTCFDYLTHSPVVRVPSFTYSQEVNQSLSAGILRALGPEAAAHPLDYKPLLMSAVAILALAFVGFIARAPSSQTPWVYSGALVLALLIYPGSLTHYSVLHAVPILAAWARFSGAGRSAIVAATLISIDYALINAPGGRLILFAHLFALSALVWLITRRAESRPPHAA